MFLKKATRKINLAPSTITGCTVAENSSENVFLKRKDTFINVLLKYKLPP